ncbi:hypothetical protein P154DRAFT_518642 [Amniculicola lignicola CBS 123094]|uniref:Integral membrane protein n=1 Tax=Amniculicola lignicola CBS 123094 TaxID=1392246 RepID=A0A6A5WVT2_9PLEO|nr:hypothetical protein P154DRAFT_518642 [Amniculicola lignicola CBS 123094]
MAASTRGAPQLRLVRPLATAYALGLLSSTSPRIIKILILVAKRKLEPHAAWRQLNRVIRQALALHRFPTFCGVLVGGSTLLPIPVYRLVSGVLQAIPVVPTISTSQRRRFATFLAALLSASLSFRLLNRVPTSLQQDVEAAQPLTHLEVCSPGPFDEPPERSSREIDASTLDAKLLTRSDLAGRTMDLTLFSVIRALDIAVSTMWDHATRSGTAEKAKLVSSITPPLLFCFSAATIMHAWFYTPSRLPTTYNRWISAAAELDQRLLLTLRHARYGTWVYGKDTGMASLLGSMCHDYGLPEEYGDPSKTVPIPCELVHMGRGKSCEKHAVLRFCRGWAFAAKMYAPLQLVILARFARKHRRAGDQYGLSGLNLDATVRAAVDMARSSAFLGAFIALFYYNVCLSRTRLGPKLFSSKVVTPQMWDSGLCVLAGCLMCGWSVLFERPRKRLEILFFVLPRAAATWFPRRYLPEDRWKEHLAFSISAAVVLTTAQESPRRVRGVLGKVLHGVLSTK